MISFFKETVSPPAYFAQRGPLIVGIVLVVYAVAATNLCWAQKPNNAGLKLREQLQSLVAGNSKLDGTRIDSAKPIVKNERKTFVFDGILGHADQLAELRSMIQKYATRRGIEVDLKAFEQTNAPKIIPIDIFRELLQAQLSSIETLSGTRIDRVFYSRDGSLSLSGIAWIPQNNPLVAKQLEKQIEEATVKFVLNEKERWYDLQEGGRVYVDGIEVVENPLTAVRELISKNRALDGVHAEKVAYGPDGILNITGSAAKETQLGELLLLLQTAQKEHEAWNKWVGPSKTAAIEYNEYIPHAKLQLVLEEAIMRAILSTKLTEVDAGKGLNSKVLFNRIYYSREDALAFEGLRWDELTGAQQGLLKNQIKAILTEEQTANPIVKGSAVNVEGLSLFNMAAVPFRSALASAWELIPQHKELDGVRLDRAYYKNGVLVFTGIQANSTQTALLKDQIQLADPLWNTLAPKGIAFDAFPIVDTETLLDEIQNRYAFHAQTPAIDGARLDRIYYQFDADQQSLRPTFSIDRWHTGQAAGAIQPASIEAVTIQNMLQALPAQWSTVTAWGAPDFQLANERPSPLPVLRQEIAQDTSMDGTRIDRAFYDPSGKLYFEGLIGDEQQLHAVNVLVQTTLGRMGGGNDEYTPQGFAVNRDRFRLIPNAIVLEWIQDLLPGYEKLDGAGVSRLFFAPNNALAVDGRIAVKNQTADISKILGEALQQTSWGRELMKGNTNQLVKTDRFDLFPVRHDPIEAMALLSTAWQIFYCGDYESAIKKLDMAILYDPGNTQLWMLRSLCYIGLREIVYARRDARRAVLSMKNNQYRYHGRYRTLSKVQGSIRLCFEALMQEVWASRANGAIVSMPLPNL